MAGRGNPGLRSVYKEKATWRCISGIEFGIAMTMGGSLWWCILHRRNRNAHLRTQVTPAKLPSFDRGSAKLPGIQSGATRR